MNNEFKKIIGILLNYNIPFHIKGDIIIVDDGSCIVKQLPDGSVQAFSFQNTFTGNAIDTISKMF